MKLKHDSWHVKVNDYVYGSGYSIKNKNLCPYFWGTILAIVMIVPFTIYVMIKSVLSEGTKKNIVRYNFCLIMSGMGLVNLVAGGSIYMYQFVATCIGFAVLYIAYETDLFQTLFAKFSKDKPPKPSKPAKVRRPSMTVEMIKGWKNKHCPMVEWD